MKEFPSLYAGLHYLDNCPVCAKYMNYNFDAYTDYMDGILINYVSADYSDEFNFALNGNGSLKIVLNRYRIIEFTITETTRFQNIRTIGGGIVQTIMAPRSPIPQYCIISKSCRERHYGFMLRLDIQAYHKQNMPVYLDSEIISTSTDHSDGTIYINNSYSDMTTIYGATPYISGNKYIISKKISLPLIPVDINNINDFITRVKNLVIFS